MNQELNNTGVYTITNLIDNKIYVGSTTVSFYFRKKKHFNSLKNNKHTNKHLQRAYNKYGAENFEFEILETCEKEYCTSTEQYWMNMLNVCNDKYGYNNRPVAQNNIGVRRNEETKKRISLTIKRIMNTKEAKQKISDRHKGIPLSIEHKLNISKSLKGRKLSEEHKIKVGLIHKGKVASEELLKKLRVSHAEYIIYQYDLSMNLINTHIEGVHQASKDTNTPSTSIYECAKGNRKHAGGFIWKRELINKEVSNG